MVAGIIRELGRIPRGPGVSGDWWVRPPPYSSYGFEELALLVKRKGGQEGNNRILPSEGGYKRGWGVVVCTTNRCRWREWVVATLTGWNGDLEVVSNELPEDCRSKVTANLVFSR